MPGNNMLCCAALCCPVLCADSQHKWNKDQADWGFTQFIPYADAVNPEKGYLLNDTMKIKVEIQVQVRNERPDKGVQEGGVTCSTGWQGVWGVCDGRVQKGSASASETARVVQRGLKRSAGATAAG